MILEDDKFTCASLHPILVVTISYVSFFFSYVLPILSSYVDMKLRSYPGVELKGKHSPISHQE